MHAAARLLRCQLNDRCRSAPLQLLLHRFASTKAKKPPVPPLEGYPFELSLPEAEARFAQFCKSKGASAALTVHNVIRGRTTYRADSITPTYLPFWAFDCSARTLSGRSIVRESRLGYADVCAVYAGYVHNRLLLQGLPSTLIGAQPFNSKWQNAPHAFSSAPSPIKLDEWQVHQRTAWRAVRQLVAEQEQKDAREAYGASLPSEKLRCEFALYGVRRIYLPVYVFQYSFFGSTFDVYVSGRRAGPEASGIDHGNLTASLSQSFNDASGQLDRQLQNLLRVMTGVGLPSNTASEFIRSFVGRAVAVAITSAFAVSRIVVTRFPLFWPFAIGGFVLYRKVSQYFVELMHPAS
jgi:hypothetical protein